jgi:protein phosphatase
VATAREAQLAALFGDLEADVIVAGHAHVPALRRFDGRLIVNPGSLGQPRYGTPDATYAVWEDGRVQIKHLHYDHHAVVGRLRLAPFSSEVADQMAAILETGLVQ